MAILFSFFAVTFQPSREAVIVWFRSSFIEEKSYELDRYELRRKTVTHGFSIAEIDSLFNDGVITLKEKQEMLYELENIDINERITRRMYGLPNDSSAR